MKYFFLSAMLLSSVLIKAENCAESRSDLSRLCENAICAFSNIQRNLSSMDEEQVNALMNFAAQAHKFMKEAGIDTLPMFEGQEIEKSSFDGIALEGDSKLNIIQIVKDDIEPVKGAKQKESSVDDKGKNNNFGEMNLHDSSVNILQIDGNIDAGKQDPNPQLPCCNNNNITVNGNISIYGFIIDSNLFKYPDVCEPVPCCQPQQNCSPAPMPMPAPFHAQ